MSAHLQSIVLRSLSAIFACAIYFATGQISQAASNAVETFDSKASTCSLVPPGVHIETTPLEEQVFDQAAANQLDIRSLWHGALVAGGINNAARLKQYQWQLTNWCDELLPLIRDDSSEQERAAIAFHFMHQRILSGRYDAQCSDLTKLVDEGRYNCIGSTILFQCLAAHAGLPTAAAESPGHAFCWLWIDGQRIAVETTNPQWFKRLTPISNEVSAPRSDDPRVKAPAGRELTAAETIAMIYYNRAYLLLREKQFAASIAANAKALRLDPASDISRDNLLAAINNWALDLHQQGSSELAVDLLLHGLRVAPNHRPFLVNLQLLQK